MTVLPPDNSVCADDSIIDATAFLVKGQFSAAEFRVTRADRLPELETFGERLAWAMRRARLRNPDVSQALGTTSETVSRWKGGATPDDSRYEPLAALFREHGVPITAEWLQRGSAGARGAIAEAMLGGPEAADRVRKERLWLARFRADLVEIDATDTEILAAEALLQTPEAARFFGDGLTAMERLGPLLRTSIVARQLAAAEARGASQDEQLEIIARFPREAFVPVQPKPKAGGETKAPSTEKRRRGNG